MIMKRTSFVLSFIFGLLLLSNSSVVFADGSKEFIPDPKPDDAYFEDQFSKRKAMYEEKGYVEVDPSTSSSWERTFEVRGNYSTRNK